ncbi:uncharacterized protein LOC134180430 [Corticium candelabrum]|uniref:uncharacterized protein LOC134180430 n=1 Tax=Corticium candelabrum TaxID=121492 RepID=UPI002E25A09E|nr:uncharacterized protein LOC134180430 [Corticium candelabrum]
MSTHVFCCWLHDGTRSFTQSSLPSLTRQKECWRLAHCNFGIHKICIETTQILFGEFGEIRYAIGSWIERCGCGATLDDLGYHLLTCKKAGGPVWSHDSVVCEWDDCTHLQLHHKQEPRDRYSNSNNRPDIAVFNVRSGANVELNVALSHPWASSILNQAAEKDQAAAARREERKTIKYSQFKLHGAPPLRFVPLVMEHSVRWGKEVNKHLQKLYRGHQTIQAKTTAREFAFGRNTSQRHCRGVTLTQSPRRF